MRKRQATATEALSPSSEAAAGAGAATPPFPPSFPCTIEQTKSVSKATSRGSRMEEEDDDDETDTLFSRVGMGLVKCVQ